MEEQAMYKRLLVFGILFALVGGFFFYNLTTEETMRINRRIVTQEEAREEVWPFLLPIGFALAGVCIAAYSAIHILRDRNTDTYGKEAYGIISDVMDSGTRINHVPQWKAWVLVAEENGDVFEKSESVGENRNRYKAGQFVRVKYTDNDINILQRVGRSSLPAGVADRLEEEYRLTTQN